MKVPAIRKAIRPPCGRSLARRKKRSRERASELDHSEEARSASIDFSISGIIARAALLINVFNGIGQVHRSSTDRRKYTCD